MTDSPGLHELDYFTLPEAARYCRVSDSQFQRWAADQGIYPFTFMGKTLYAKEDVRAVIERERRKWLPSTQGAAPGSCSGARRGVSTGEALVRARVPTPSGQKPSKKRS